MDVYCVCVRCCRRVRVFHAIFRRRVSICLGFAQFYFSYFLWIHLFVRIGSNQSASTYCRLLCKLLQPRWSSVWETCRNGCQQKKKNKENKNGIRSLFAGDLWNFVSKNNKVNFQCSIFGFAGTVCELREWEVPRSTFVSMRLMLWLWISHIKRKSKQFTQSYLLSMCPCVYVSIRVCDCIQQAI